jgi:hypothetical protein
MKLTEHFGYAELKIDGTDERVVANALHLCNEVLEPIREQWGSLSITSGYRDWQKNKDIGGAWDSQHLYLGGNAAVDFKPAKSNLREVFNWIRLISKIKVDQVILEFQNGLPSIIHVSTNRDKLPRQMALTGQTFGKGPYSKVEFIK